MTRWLVAIALVACGEATPPLPERGAPDASAPDSGASCTPIAPISIGAAFDPLPIVEQAKIPLGPYAGDWLVGKGGAVLNWYFACLGAMGFVDRVPGEVRAFLDSYLAHLAPDRSIGDVYFGYRDGICVDGDPAAAGNPVAYDCPYGKTNASGQYADSNDSYAAVFLSLANRYYQVTCDAAWARANIATLEAIADATLVGAEFPNHLVHVFQDQNAYPGAYTEDDCEDAKGLADLAALLGALGDDAGRAKYAAASAQIASAVASVMFTTDLASGAKQLGEAGFYSLWSGSPAPLSDPPVFYPDGATQIFPEAYALGLPQSDYAAGWAFLDQHFPSPPYDEDPWTIIGYAAALEGNVARAKAAQALTTSTYQTTPAWVPLNDWGFYERITLVLEGVAPF